MKHPIRRFNVLSVVLFSVSFAAFANTRMVSQVNPETRELRFSNVLVIVDVQSAKDRNLGEDGLCSEFSRVQACECLKGSEILFPGRPYTLEELTTVLTAHNVESVLIVQTTDAGSSQQWVPGVSMLPSGTQWIQPTLPVPLPGGQTPLQGTQGPVATMSAQQWDNGAGSLVTTPGHYKEVPWARYEVSLRSVIDGEVVWWAIASSHGQSSKKSGKLIKSAARKTVTQLIADGVFRSASTR